MAETRKPIGLVAGWGNYPLMVAKSLKEKGESVVVVAIKDHATEELAKVADEIRWFGVAKLGAQQRWLRKFGTEQVVLAGKIFKGRIFFHGLGWIGHLPDWECMKTFYPHVVTRKKDSRDDTLLHAIVGSFERNGMKVVPGTDLATQLIVEEGCLTRNQPNANVRKDMIFGWEIAKRMGDLDVGQSVTVKHQTVLCVEALEGTDACIARSADVCPNGGFTLVKVAKPRQDMRFDLPTIGLNTIQGLVKAGGTAILMEANKTILLEREEVIDFANKHGVTMVAWSNEAAQVREVA